MRYRCRKGTRTKGHTKKLFANLIKITMKIFPTSVVLCQIIGFGLTLDYTQISEYHKCDQYLVDQKLDEDWLGSVPAWYTSIWSNVEAYQHAQDLLSRDEFASLTRKGLEQMCLYYKANGSMVISTGFGGRTARYEAHPDPIRKGIVYWAVPCANGEKRYLATSYITKTDNKSYFVEVTLWWTGMKGWNVGSNVPKLDNNKYREIRQHLIDIGFDPENYFNVDYNKCPPSPL